MQYCRGLLGVMLAACTMAVGCASTGSGGPTVGQPVERQHRSVTVGQAVRFMLVSNRTTGFEWTINLAASQGMEYISIQKTGYTTTDSPQGEVGAPGRQWWVVQGDSPGRAEIHMVYRRVVGGRYPTGSPGPRYHRRVPVAIIAGGPRGRVAILGGLPIVVSCCPSRSTACRWTRPP